MEHRQTGLETERLLLTAGYSGRAAFKRRGGAAERGVRGPLAVRADRRSGIALLAGSAGRSIILLDGCRRTAGGAGFAPQQLPSPPATGPLLLDELLLFNLPVRPRPDERDALLQRTLAHTARVRLSHRDEVFGFSFAALDYRSADRVGYRYRLDGLHADWIPALPDQRSVSFSGVPAGNHRFRVQARREDGEPRETGIEVSIAPAPWRFQRPSSCVNASSAALFAISLPAEPGSVLSAFQKRLLDCRGLSRAFATASRPVKIWSRSTTA